MPEFDFIAWLKQQSKRDDRIVVPLGDDLAAMKWPADDLLLVGVDQVLDGVHFDSAIHSPRQIGRKAMNRNLSDCAAMACLPAAAVCTLALPKGVGEDYAKELILGLRDAGEPFDCPIVGGDTGSWPGRLVVTVTILGRSGGVKPVTRSGAKAGDKLYVTGPLGGSIHGRHMTFEPRVKLGRYLASNFQINAMCDLSDGLGRDLRNMCVASSLGAYVDVMKLPIHDDLKVLDSEIDERVHAFSDGEDYELLVASPDPLPEPCVEIGWLQNKPGLEMDTNGSIVEMDWSDIDGWEHEL